MDSMDYSLNQLVQSMDYDTIKFVAVVVLGLYAIIFVKLLKAYLFNSEGKIETFLDVVIIIIFVLIGFFFVGCVFNIDFLINYILHNWNN